MHTPTLDALAADGLKLSHFYTFKECAPSRGSIMTGRYPYHFGYYRNPSDDGAVPLSFSLLPEVLRTKAGYATAAVGKWHIGMRSKHHTPTMRGFDKPCFQKPCFDLCLRRTCAQMVAKGKCINNTAVL